MTMPDLHNLPAAMAARVEEFASNIDASEDSLDSVIIEGDDVIIAWTDCEGDDGEVPFGARTLRIARWKAQVSLILADASEHPIQTFNMAEVEDARELARSIQSSVCNVGMEVRILKIKGW